MRRHWFGEENPFYLHFENWMSVICKTLRYFTQGCFMPSLVELVPVILENLNTLHPRMLCDKFGLKFSLCFSRRFWISSMHFHFFVIISPWKMVGPFIWTNWNPLQPRLLCAKFGWNWPIGPGEEDFKNFGGGGSNTQIIHLIIKNLFICYFCLYIVYIFI